MYRSDTAIVTGPESAICHETVSALGRVGMNVRRAARSSEIDSIAATLNSFDVLVTLPRRRRKSVAQRRNELESTGLTSEVEYVLRCLQPAIRRMSESGRGGRIVIVVSADVDIGTLTGALATEVSEVGISVNSVVFGDGVSDSDACDVITYLAGSAAAGQVTGASYTLTGNEMVVRGASTPTSKRGERFLPSSVRSRLRALHAGRDR